MSKVVLISVASAVGFGLLSLHLVNRLKAGEATIADLQAQVAALQEQRQPPPPPPAPSPPPEAIAPQPSGSHRYATEGTAEDRQRPSCAPNQLVSPGPPNREDRMRMFREQRERQRQLMQDPEYREAMRVQTRGNFRASVSWSDSRARPGRATSGRVLRSARRSAAARQRPDASRCGTWRARTTAIRPPCRNVIARSSSRRRRISARTRRRWPRSWVRTSCRRGRSINPAWACATSWRTCAIRSRRTGLPLSEEREQAHAQGAGAGEQNPKRTSTSPPPIAEVPGAGAPPGPTQASTEPQHGAATSRP